MSAVDLPRRLTSATTVELPEDVREALVIRPGDTLIVRVPSTMDPAALDAAVEKCQERLPGVRFLFLGAEQLAVYRPDPQATP